MPGDQHSSTRKGNPEEFMAVFRRDLVHFCSHSLAEIQVHWPNLNAGNAGKCNLAENSKEGKKREMASSLAP